MGIFYEHSIETLVTRESSGQFLITCSENCVTRPCFSKLSFGFSTQLQA